MMARMLRWVPAIIWTGVIFYGSSQSALPIDGQPNSGALHKLGHIVEYAILALLVAAATGVSGRRLTLGFLIASGNAIADEIHQTFVPGRQGAADQVALDIVVVAVTLGMLWLIARSANRRRTSTSPLSRTDAPFDTS